MQRGVALLLACLALAAFSSSHAFAPSIGFAPRTQGSFVSSVRPALCAARSGRVTPSFSVLTVSAALRNADKIGKPIPNNFKEGQQYTVGGKFAVGDLVFVTRSDGTKRYGEVVGAAGLPWQDQWEIVVDLDGGEVGATRVELAKDINKVTVGGAPAGGGGSMLIGRGASPVRAAPAQAKRAAPAPANRAAPAPVRPMGTARVGSQRVTIPSRGSQRVPAPAARAVPGSQRTPPPRGAPPAPKAPAPKKISLVARPPPAQTPKPAARAAPAPARSLSGRAPPAAAAKKPAAPAIPFADKLARSVPESWTEGEEYKAASAVQPQQLVLVDTATGLKFAVVLAKTGFFWQNNYRVATSVSPSGGAGSEEEVSVEALYTPSQAALDEMDKPVAAVGGFFAGILKNFAPKEEAPPQKKAAPAFPKAAAKPPAAPPSGPLGSIMGGLGSLSNRLGSLLPEEKKEVKKEVATPAPVAAKPAAAKAGAPAAPAAKAAPASGRVDSIAALADTASNAGRDVALGFLNGLSKALGDDDSAPKKEEAPKAKAPAAPAKPAAAAPKKEAAAAKKEEPKKEEPKKEAPAAAAAAAAAPKQEEAPKAKAPAAPAPKKEEPKPTPAASSSSSSSQGPPPGLGLKVPLAKKNALEENLRRAERPGDLNLGLGPEWEGWTPKEE